MKLCTTTFVRVLFCCPNNYFATKFMIDFDTRKTNTNTQYYYDVRNGNPSFCRKGHFEWLLR